MRVTFLLPFINHRGGSQLVIDVANHLTDLGDQVWVVWPTRLKLLPWPLNEIEYLWRGPWKTLTCRWYTSRAAVRARPSLRECYIPEGDVVVATAWQTARWAASYGPSRGRKVYYIFEPEIHKDEEGCVATYRLPFDRRISISEWTSEALRSRYGTRIDRVTPVGLEEGRFPERQAPPSPSVRHVGMLHESSTKKGFEDGYQAFLAVREKHPDLRLHLLGVSRRPPAFPDFVVPHFRVSHEHKVRLFHTTDVWLAPSLQEGWGLVPMEAMACGNAVVTTRVGGTPYFAVDGQTALVVDPGDRRGLAAALERLVVDTELRHRLIRQGTVEARRLKMRDTATLFRDALTELLQE
ncbi:MAG: glycosyltransferase family 4 protein [Candidatus Riflebacteria bacterium]|nr:glycosyltransferase family 4 protein [Candidatus Riflebacteria bacterium]